MAIGMVMRFSGVGAAEYEAVMGPDGLDLDSPGNPGAGGTWPEGLASHHAGPTPDGWCVSDVWESRELLDAFVGGRLGPVLGRLGLPEPELTFYDVYNGHT
jgi:hypothetical protein